MHPTPNTPVPSPPCPSPVDQLQRLQFHANLSRGLGPFYRSPSPPYSGEVIFVSYCVAIARVLVYTRILRVAVNVLLRRVSFRSQGEKPAKT